MVLRIISCGFWQRKCVRNKSFFSGRGMAISRITVSTVRFHRNQTMSVGLSDGRVITVPLIWYPRLAGATAKARRRWEISCAGQGIRWPELNEDVSIEGILAGAPSPEYRKPRSVKSSPRELRAH
jgi:hypothetical protein